MPEKDSSLYRWAVLAVEVASLGILVYLLVPGARYPVRNVARMARWHATRAVRRLRQLDDPSWLKEARKVRGL